MKKLIKILCVFILACQLSGCLVTSVVGGAISAVDAVTPDIID